VKGVLIEAGAGMPPAVVQQHPAFAAFAQQCGLRALRNS
jgi:hypothetical protein